MFLARSASFLEMSYSFSASRVMEVRWRHRVHR